MTFYHNPRCRKSREALAILEEKGINPEIRLYLEKLLSQKEIKAVLALLKMNPEDLVRKSEPIFKSDFKGKTLTEAGWIKAMAAHPKLIERPILVNGKKAVLGRPPENVLEII
ncbi:MAG: arsenate reductase [Limisphaerales bacterium]|jgi:arsenate reductase